MVAAASPLCAGRRRGARARRLGGRCGDRPDGARPGRARVFGHRRRRVHAALVAGREEAGLRRPRDGARGRTGRSFRPGTSRLSWKLQLRASVGVPGVLRMLELAHQRHGRRPWNELFGAAIRIAEEGFDASPKLQEALSRERPPGRSSCKKVYYSVRELTTASAETLCLAPRRRRATRATSRRCHCARGAHARKARRPHGSGSAHLPRARARGGVRPVSKPARLLHGSAELGRRRRPADPVLERTSFAARACAVGAALHLFAEAGKLALRRPRGATGRSGLCRRSRKL